MPPAPYGTASLNIAHAGPRNWVLEAMGCVVDFVRGVYIINGDIQKCAHGHS